MARKKHLSVESILDDSVMNPDMTVPRPPTGNPVAIHLKQAMERHQENERKSVAIDDAQKEEK